MNYTIYLTFYSYIRKYIYFSYFILNSQVSIIYSLFYSLYLLNLFFYLLFYLIIPSLFLILLVYLSFLLLLLVFRFLLFILNSLNYFLVFIDNIPLVSSSYLYRLFIFLYNRSYISSYKAIYLIQLFSGFFYPPYFQIHTSPTYRTHSEHLIHLALGSRTYYK
jgi:hypothetical protein